MDTALRVSDFHYDLPADRIAQRRTARRVDARMMVLEASSGPRHARFGELPGLLRGDELLVYNDTRVVPARLHARKASGGKVSLLVVEDEGDGDVVALAKSSKPLRTGARLAVAGADGDEAALTVVAALGRGRYRLRLPEGSDLDGFLDARGELPLPPYIARPEGPTPEDADAYQTVFARHRGAVAAPTAGLHFTASLLEDIRARGCELAAVTLHVGPGTFRPVRTERVEAHEMHAERYVVPDETARAVADAKRTGRPILAIGTTVVRTLEAAARRAPSERGAYPIAPGGATTDIFIYPGFAFSVVDQLITNFHLPASTLLMLTCAFGGTDRVMAAYREAVREGYRFYSYGDGMWLR